MLTNCPKCGSPDLRHDQESNEDLICMGCGTILVNIPAESSVTETQPNSPKEELLTTVKKQVAVGLSVASEVVNTATNYMTGGQLKADLLKGKEEVKSVPRRLGLLWGSVKKELKDLADQGDQLRGKK